MELNSENFEKESKKVIRELIKENAKFSDLINKLQEGLETVSQKQQQEEALIENIKK